MSRFRLAALCLAVASLAAAGADPIRVPSPPVPPTPMPSPAPKAADTLRLTPDLLYVVDSDVPCLVLASPPGRVAVTKKAGPMAVHGQFADAPGKRQFREFAGKHLWFVEAVGAGPVELLVVPAGADDESKVIRRLLDVDDGHKPNPPPGPAPDPGPKPAPFPGAKLFVKVVAERKAMPPAQADLLASPTLRKWLTDRGHELEILDPASEAAAAMNLGPFVAKAGGAPALVLLLSGGANPGLVPDGVGAVKLPATEAAFVAAVEAVTGK